MRIRYSSQSDLSMQCISWFSWPDKYWPGQMLATLVLLYTGKVLGTVRLPDLSLASLSQVWPLPLFYLGNLVFGLGGTQALSLPMLTVLRRFSILLTMIGERERERGLSVSV